MKKQFKYVIAIIILVLTMTGCTSYIKDKDNNVVSNPETGQNLTENILCRPTDANTIKLYEESGYDIKSLPYCTCVSETYTEGEYTNGEYTENVYTCDQYSVSSGGYEGLWTTLFVKPLAWVILLFGRIFQNYGVGLIVTSILIRLVLYPFTNKSTKQAESMKKIQPELDRLEKKYANVDQTDKDAMMKKSQEMMAIYKKYNINPLSSCLVALIQLPLLMAFLEAINRVPAIFEETILGLHLGTSPKVGIMNGNWWYVVIILLVAATTFYSLRKANGQNNSETAKQTNTMMNVMIVIIIVTSIFMSTALDIYWITSNLFTIIQTLIVKRSIK